MLRKYAARSLDNSLALYAGFAGLVVLMIAVFIFSADWPAAPEVTFDSGAGTHLAYQSWSV